MKQPVIRAIGHVAIRTEHLDACVDQAVQVMGLVETARDGEGAYLSEGSRHHSLQYIADDSGAVDHIGLEAADGDALLELRGRLEAENVRIVEVVDDDLLGASVSFVGPEEFVFQAYVGMPPAPAPQRQTSLYASQATTGVRPNRFGHVTVRVRDTQRMCDFLCTVLDFRISDAVSGGFFVRCNVDHHGLGVMPGPGEMHHHAWEVQSVADLARIGDRVHESGKHLLWGIVRHGVGNNIAAYFPDPAGPVVEYYTDMQKIYDDSDFQLREWDEDWYSMWSLGRPEGFADYGVPPALAARAAR
jgi:catechol 2,3-dioxygenase